MSFAPMLLSALIIVSQPNPSDDLPSGRRIDLGGEATLFVADGYRPRDGKVDVVLHLHGSSKVVESAMVASRWTAVLIEFNRNGLSSVYSKPFADRTLFPRLLDATLRSLADAKIVDSPQLGRVAVSAFSAGFGGVRELLKIPEHFERIDTLILADSLYCGYGGDPSLKKLDPKLMDGFRQFASEAAAGSKVMVLSHSTQVPDGYGSTTETADDLMRVIGGETTAERVDRGDGWVQSREFRRGGMVILGFDGAGPEDHMRHLRRIGELWSIAQASAKR